MNNDLLNILLDDECKKFILSISNNSIKILINYLEKLKLINLPITLELVSDVCTNITFKDFEHFTKYCKHFQPDGRPQLDHPLLLLVFQSILDFQPSL